MGGSGVFGPRARPSPRRTDPLKKLVDFLASLKLAVILLVVLLVGLSAGTIVESRSSAEEAGRLVYYSWWFLGLQGLFALNVALSIAQLFPWGRKRVGFVVVHASLLLILAGAALTYFFKVEGSLGLWEGETGSVIEDHDREGKLLSRTELPFSVKLEDFVLETYQGTMRPSGYVSHVVVTDKDTGKSFAAKIWMNHELHHRGYALFQSSYQQTGGREATVLSVSKDPGQLVVFVGYVTLVLGMLIVLFTRIGKARERAAFEAKVASTGMSLPTVGRALVAGLGLGLGLLSPAAPARAEALPSPDVLRRLPVQNDGRVMPLDTLAHETVWNVTGSHAWNGEDPVATFAGWYLDPQAAANAPVVQLGSAEIARAAGLDPSAKHASFEQLVGSRKVMQLLQAARNAEREERPRTGVLKAVEKLEQRLLALQAVLQREAIRPLPVPGDPNARWNLPPDPTAEGLVRLAEGRRLPGWPSAKAIDREILYNRVNPSRVAWIVLAASLLVSIAAWGSKGKLLDGVAFALLLLGFAAMTWGIGMRWAAADRIPASNMYESLLFLAWGVGLFAVIAYAVLRNRVVVINAAVMSALTMALTDLLPIDRFIHPVAPVLAGTPWLAIHVPIIMVGYAVLGLGLVVAHMQIGFAAFSRTGELAARMYELLYWYMFTGSILLLAGILTGSMWAASSWGRYWGWDPKEVWSLVAFLAYMAILHLKVDKVIGTFGVAVISIAAFQTILMTYLGVNFVLNVGMHSYGMGDSPVVKWMVLVGIAELVYVLVCVVSHRDRRLAAA